MNKVVIKSLFDKEVAIKDENKSLLWHFQQTSIDWMQACGGKGKCTTCKVKIFEGKEYLKELTEAEQKFIKQKRLLDSERLTCQASFMENIEKKILSIGIPKKYRFPHIKYSE